MWHNKQGWTLLETIMVTVIISILASLAIPKFIDLRNKAEEARSLANIGAMRSAILIYYSKTALPQYEYLCDAARNPYRNVTVPNPCYPATYEEVESLLTSPPQWGSSGSGACYNSITGQIGPCQ